MSPNTLFYLVKKKLKIMVETDIMSGFLKFLIFCNQRLKSLKNVPKWTYFAGGGYAHGSFDKELESFQRGKALKRRLAR